MSRKMALRRLCAVAGVSLGVFTITTAAAHAEQPLSDAPAQVYEARNRDTLQTHLRTSESAANASTPNAPSYSLYTTSILQDLHDGLETMQSSYFSIWLGKYTTAIDWTAAVMATHVSATLASLSRSLTYTMPGTFDKSKNLDVEAQMVENEINKYFGQIATYYFGEDHFAIRMQAYDDILWVVLGWLESIQFIEGHSAEHYASGSQKEAAVPEWHARQFIPAFAHRARIFYEIAEKGWDWRLCGGGMTWNPRLLPYKNAITNELFISASIGMYLHFPGDANCAPFLSQYDDIKDKKNRKPSDKLLRAQERGEQCDENTQTESSYDPVYLANAINGYDWLKNSGMKNKQGLYVDGFHIAGYRTNHSKTECDERNEMVYTYNQGVILSGLRGLWEASGKQTYLEDGHELIRNVIRATGWTDGQIFAAASTHPEKPDQIPESHRDILTSWAGLGAGGILAEACDPSGSCNQNGQTFKGIFFHHLTTFCKPLPAVPVRLGRTYAASRETRILHARSCKEYTKWVVHNAKAALRTTNKEGRFGSWWGANGHAGQILRVRRVANAMDYQNRPDEYSARFEEEAHTSDDAGGAEDEDERLAGHDMTGDHDERDDTASRDWNDRGRGRTVETQGSGVAVLRAMLEFERLGQSDDGGFVP
ncbi:glycoside hydrolase family 76 protein [Didymella exigua CBS 183.55]|uniref:Glycoside hydrolase family 76 protein n=1 Tax=Didymella exigua CBS 183.55 TaxID=1150837 RepID=A0A6A5RVU5_9PLEO|nr:glycoside hydrolase family 76 protein [Didymella exigua CBS 183.55]KAF1931098.1 glycoside hydrolase family 76 protein [Didymella exigua CBS 183.55]